MSMRPRVSSVVASIERMLVFIPATLALTAATMPFLSSTCTASRTVNAPSPCPALSHSTSMRRSGSYIRLTTFEHDAECTDTPLPRLM